MKLCELTRPELMRYERECNFTDEECKLFRLRSQDATYEACAEQMNVSVATAYRIAKRIKQKMNRV